ncbi:hypothetical protein AYO39_03305 [Actinobacteria bacterium SCGC AG-212-D09]|nr:hypothetical protein AYO39_03305 [Actinobacteria bacterium SCGC AG-212-D09]
MDSSVRISRSAGALGLILLLAALPLALWHRVLSDILVSFHWSLSYVGAELGPWLLLLAGVMFLIPVAVSSGLHPESRLYPRARRSYLVWGVVLYLLGALLAAQLFEVWGYSH